MRGSGARGPRPNAIATSSPHQTSSAATLRTASGDPPPLTASSTTRNAMSGPSVNRSRSGHRRRGPSGRAFSRIPVAVLAFVVLMLLPPAATAASGADPSNPSLDQYVESVPTSHGDPPGGGGSTRGHISTSHLPASVRHQIAAHGGRDATQLEAIATSPVFGAPADAVASTTGRPAATPGTGTGTGSGAGRHSTAQPLPASGDSRPSGVDAFTTAATHGGGSSTGVLAIGLVVIALMAGGIALSRRRANLA